MATPLERVVTDPQDRFDSAEQEFSAAEAKDLPRLIVEARRDCWVSASPECQTSIAVRF